MMIGHFLVLRVRMDKGRVDDLDTTCMNFETLTTIYCGFKFFFIYFL